MKNCKNCYRVRHSLVEYVFSKEWNLELSTVCRYIKKVITEDNINEETECDRFITPREYFKDI